MIPRIVAAVLALLAVAIALTSCGTIESGNVGVRTTLGKVNPEEVEPGIYLGLPASAACRSSPPRRSAST